MKWRGAGSRAKTLGTARGQVGNDRNVRNRILTNKSRGRRYYGVPCVLFISVVQPTLKSSLREDRAGSEASVPHEGQLSSDIRTGEQDG